MSSTSLLGRDGINEELLQMEDIEDDFDDGSEHSESEDDTSSENADSQDEDIGPEEAAAETEIEGDFDRLVQNIRVGDVSSTDAGVLAKDWDFNIEERDAEFRDDLRAASGIGRKRSKKRGRHTGPVLSQQVRSLVGDGNQAYVDNNIPEAIRIMQEVIRIEPRATSAWSVLAQCYEDTNQSQKGLQLRIMAAHLRHDAEEWDRLARQSRELGYNQQALYCYRKVYSLDPANVDALWDRASLAKEIGDLRTARTAFLAILKRFPHDLTVIGELRTILIELSDLALCTSLYQEAFGHYQTVYPSGRGVDPVSGNEVVGGGFALMEILVLADLHNTLGEHDRAVLVIRKGCRWLQGRRDQTYWDACEDDREYDLPGLELLRAAASHGEAGPAEPGRYTLDINARHRLAVARIKMGDIEEGMMHSGIVLAQDVFDYAPLFAEIADAYFERGLYAEAKPIYELLGTDAVTSSLYVLLQTAACLRMLDELKEAAEVYEHVRIADPTNNEAKIKLAEIYEILNEPRKALELVYEVIDSRKKRPKETDAQYSENPADPSSTSLFAEERAVVAKSRAAAIRAHNRLTHAQVRELEAQKEREVVRGYRRVKELWPRMLKAAKGEAGEEDADVESLTEWMMEAEKLVETFRETRNLFLTSRTNPFRGMFPRSRAAKQQLETSEADQERMASRLQLDLEHDSQARGGKAGKSNEKRGKVDIFRGVSFDDWLRLFMQYCFLLSQRGQFELADEILRHIMVSNAYQTREQQDSIRLTLLTCAVVTQRYPIVVEQARKIITAHQFNNEPQRILVAALSSGLRPTDAFITSTLQKHLFREMKVADTVVKHPELMKWNPMNKRYAPTATARSKSGEQEDGGDDDGDGEEIARDGGGSLDNDASTAANDKNIGAPELPTKNNPLVVAIYGQICIAAKSYQSAIFYLLHAYDYCPDDPMICLCLAIASIGRAMQRQSDNRHHLITQAMAFLSKYRTLRGNESQGMGEVDYNFGRAFHQLGLYSHAVRHYERVLEFAENEERDKGQVNHSLSFVQEAAYNLSLIFVLTGAMPLAESLYKRWLSF